MGQVAPTMAGIKQALNHRSLSQFEQWWLVEQVEILRRAADRDAEVIEVLQGVVADRDRERDALAAQVAALVHEIENDGCCNWDNGETCGECSWCKLNAVRLGLPAAAARYLAADRVALAYETVWRESNRFGTNSGERQALAEALAEWRKAAGHE